MTFRLRPSVRCWMSMNQKTPTNFLISFLFLAVFACALPAYADELININTAGLAELETLPGVGPSVAQSIIDNRPYAAIEEVSKASGIGEPGSSSYEKIKNLITVGGVVTQTAATSSTQTQTQSQNQAAGAGPPALTVLITVDGRGTAVDAIAAAVSLAAEGDGSLLIRNLSGGDLNIGLWSLSDAGKQFVVPEDTLVLAGEGVRFASVVTGLSGTRSAVLLYPNGAAAASATVSAGSPLRGERVTAAPRRAPAAAQKQAGEVLGSSTSAPAPADS